MLECLEFVEGDYGPFAHELTGVLSRLVNNGILTEERLGRMLAVRPGPAFEGTMTRYREAIQRYEAIIQRIVDLLARRWKQRRQPPVTDLEVVTVIRDLAALSWIEVAPSSELPTGMT